MKKHPYQEQTDRVWNVIKFEIRAKENGFWIESISLSYVILEYQLRILLSCKVDKAGNPISTVKINKAEYLIALANLAKEKDIIDDGLYNKIKQFNDFRRTFIHRLLLEDLNYSQLEEPAKNAWRITEEIQSKWLKLTWGEAVPTKATNHD